MSLVSRFGPGGVTIEAAEVVALAEPEPTARLVAASIALDAQSAGPEDERQGLPYNAVTGATYQGKNVMRLASAELMHGYGPGGWAGFGQWLKVGRVVRKGEHGTACMTVVRVGADEAGKGGKTAPRGFRVFHFDQTTELVAAE